MILSKNFRFVSLIIIIGSILSSCIQYKEVEVIEVSDIGVHSLSTEKIEIEVTMKIKNPNNYKISVVDSDLELYIKGKKIGSANIKDKIVLPKKSNEKHKIVIQTGLADMLSSAVPVLMGLIFDNSIELAVKGDIKARAKSLSKRFPVDFKEKVKLN